MTDAFEVTGQFVPAETFATDSSVDTFTQISAIDAAAALAVTAAISVSASVADELASEQVAAVQALPNGFVEMGLAPELVQAVADLGFNQPTTVQNKAIPLAMPKEADASDNRFSDLMVTSQTGSGKTAAFLLPVLHTLLKLQAKSEEKSRQDFERASAEALARGEAPLKKPKRKDPTNTRNFKAATPGALILCPTRELAQQVANDAIDLVRHCRGLRIANVVGGMPYQLQIAKLQNANLVVATPGRLLDLQRSQQLKLDQVKFLVVDEADRMLDLGFSDDLAEVNQLTIDRQQTMMFSATFAPRIQQLAMRVMRNNGASLQRLTIDSPQEKHANIKQSLFWADNAHHKRKLLDHWLRDTTINQAIVFASTQIECDGLANDLQQEGFSAVALHGALSQGIRNRRLMALRQGQVQILVATDVAARGIDVPTITHVFNFGLPMKAEDYTHRIGRTGRAGRDGLAITFAELRDRRKIFDIEAYNRQPIKAEVIPGLEPQQRMASSRPPMGREGGRGGKFGGGGRGSFGGGGDRDSHFGKPARGPMQMGAGNFGGGNGRMDGERFASAQDRFAGNDRGAQDRGGFDRGHDRGFDHGNDRHAGSGYAAPRNPENYAGKSGFNDRFAGDNRNAGQPAKTGFAPRGDFADRKPAFGKPAGKPAFGAKPGFAKPGNAGKVFVPRDAAKRIAKPAR